MSEHLTTTLQRECPKKTKLSVNSHFLLKQGTNFKIKCKRGHCLSQRLQLCWQPFEAVLKTNQCGERANIDLIIHITQPSIIV